MVFTTYTNFSKIKYLALLIIFMIVVFLSPNAIAESCNSESNCESICQQHEEELNANAMTGQVYVCQLTKSHEVIVMGGDDPEGEEATSNSTSHTSYLCSCTSFIESWNTGEGRNPKDPNPGKGYPNFPKPPGGGDYVPGNPYSICMNNARKKYEECMKESEEPIKERNGFLSLSKKEQAALTAKEKITSAQCKSNAVKEQQQCAKLYKDDPVYDLKSIDMIKLRRNK